MKKIIASIWLVLLVAVIGTIFWYNDIKYSLPTPIPKGYKPVANGTIIQLPPALQKYKSGLFIHFYNPACPCSRFNKAMFKSLVIKYRSQLSFAVVALSANKYSEEQLKAMFDLDVPVIADSGLAKACGVYSTPQAVVIDQYHRLYFRGNYNISRYCTNPKTNFAELAIEDFFVSKQHPVFSELAGRAYGCSLPGCNK